MTSKKERKEKGMKKNEELKAHGTTILALKFNGGVIMAADRRCTAGRMIFSDDDIKIEEMDRLSCIAGAGYVADFQLLVETLRDEWLPNFEKFFNIDIYVDGQANLLKNIMRERELWAWPILAGWDPCQKMSRIFLVEPGGAIFERPYFAASGSGEIPALQVLKSKWSKDCSEKQGIEIAVEAILGSAEMDKNTADPLKHPPTIKVIDNEKIITVPEKTILEIAWKIFSRQMNKLGGKEKELLEMKIKSQNGAMLKSKCGKGAQK